MARVEDWRTIDGYDGMYEISFEGEVRSWRWRKAQRAKKPRLLQQFRHLGKNGMAVYVKLTDAGGKAHDVPVLSLMVAAWLGGKRPGLVAYHKNGVLDDNCVNNIGFITRQKLGKKVGASSRRRVVAKISEDGEAVEFYSSVREAARKNFMSHQTVLNRCNRNVKKEFAETGYSFRFDK